MRRSDLRGVRRLGCLLGALAVGLAAGSPADAQDFDDVVGRYTGANGVGFLQPLGDAFGANINRGFFHSARIEPGFHVQFSFVGQSAFISDDAKTFRATTGEGFLPEQTAEAPTIFGSINSVAVSGTGGTAYRFPGGLQLDVLSTAVPQLTVGSVRGSDVTVRWLGHDFGEEFGELSFLGLGLRHDVSQYLEEFPVDLAVGLYRQSLDISDIVDATAFMLSVQGSVDRSILTLYGALGYETSRMDVSFDSSVSESGRETIALEAANSVSLTAGVAVGFAIIDLWTDLTLGLQTAWALGLSFGN